MELEGNSNSETSVLFLRQLGERHAGPLSVIWDNAPAPLRQVQEWRVGAGVPAATRPGTAAGEPAGLQNLPGYSPDFNADEAIWGWVREEVTGNLCLGTREAVHERVNSFLAGLTNRKDEVRRRCRTVLQSRAERLFQDSQHHRQPQANAHPTLSLV